MSTEFYTVPEIEYAVFVAATRLEIAYPLRRYYQTQSMVLYAPGGFIHVFEGDSGEARFERFGPNNPEPVFTNILEQFPVKLFDEYGLPWPLESGG
jgi:hypothetical protein